MYTQLLKELNNELHRNKGLYNLTKHYLPLKEFDVMRIEWNAENLNGLGTEAELMCKDLIHYNANGRFKYSLIGCEIQNILDKKSVLVKTELYSRYNKNNHPDMLEMLEILKGIDVCLVGGCVRDLIQGKTPNDYDFVTSLPYDELKIFLEGYGCSVDTNGKNFLVMNVKYKSFLFEIANYRADGDYKDGRHPEEVKIGTIMEDAARRDFTINALYYNLKDDKIIDPLGTGLLDVNDRILKFIGKAKDRLEEDMLRAFRFYRFINRGYIPDGNSLRTVRSLFDKCYEMTTPERVRVELEKMCGLK